MEHGRLPGRRTNLKLSIDRLEAAPILASRPISCGVLFKFYEIKGDAMQTTLLNQIGVLFAALLIAGSGVAQYQPTCPAINSTMNFHDALAIGYPPAVQNLFTFVRG